MQIAAEVSEAPKEEFIVVAGQNIAPVIYRRLVETVARVQDNTPFIIGGLIRNESADTVDRVPILSRIPILGALFQSSSRRLEKREVIIVLTPRVLRTHGSQRPALPKDTARFDFLDNQLFRNSYRIKGDDVRDWGFLQNNPMVLEAMGEARALSLRHPEHAKRLPISELASGTVPGEDALVTRMLYEIIRYKLKSFEALKDENLVYFQKDPSKPAGFRVERLWRTLREVSPEVAHEEDPSKVLDYYFGRTEYPRKVLVVRFKVEAGGGMGGALKTPVAETGWLELAGPEDKDATDEVDKWTLEHNKLRDKEYTYGELGFVLNTARDLERLKTAIVLREVEQVNNIEELLTLRNFHVGRRIVIPELDSASPRTFLVDHQIAELYFVSDYYYTVLQAKLERAYSVLEQALASEAE
jgi:hypothetical protein